MRSKFKFKEYIKQKFEGNYLKTQINNDLLKFDNSSSHSLIFKSKSKKD